MSMLSLKSGLLHSIIAIGLMTTSYRLTAGEIRRLPQTGATSTSADVSMEQAIQIALRDNQQLRAMRYEHAAAEHDARAAATQRLPRVALETGYTLLNDERSLDLGSTFGSFVSGVRIPQAQDESVFARSTISLPLYTGGAISKSIEAANLQQVKVRWRYDHAKSRLKLNVIEAYLDVLLAQERIQFTTRNANNRRTHLHEVRIQQKNGAVTREVVLAHESAVLAFDQRLRSAQLQWESAIASLNRLLGRRTNEPIQPHSFRVPEIPADDLHSLLAISLQNRPELPELRAESESLRMTAKSIDAERKPRIGFFGEFAFQENRFVSPEGIGSLSVAATWDAFDGGQKYHQSESLHRQADSVERLILDLEQEIERQLFLARNRLRDFQSQLQTEQERRNASMESVRVADRRFIRGVGSRNEVLDAELESTRSEYEIRRLQIEISKSKFRLRYILGIL